MHLAKSRVPAVSTLEGVGVVRCSGSALNNPEILYCAEQEHNAIWLNCIVLLFGAEQYWKCRSKRAQRARDML